MQTTGITLRRKNYISGLKARDLRSTSRMNLPVVRRRVNLDIATLSFR